ncbi:MAG: rhodanese-like domain-containing protein [Gammaproteobacteria bacterium]|nr:rhodanese-like domain-containing protein [Gammaproteobacteria bacterium]
MDAHVKLFIAVFLLIITTSVAALDVRITNDLESVEVRHKGQKVLIQRIQDIDNTVDPAYARTSRRCPPFCVQPASIADGVETIAEIEVLDYLKKSSEGDDSILVIDSRTPDWLLNGTIPGSVNIPWTLLNPESGADPFEIADILENRFGARSQEGLWDFSSAKTLVLFCNGIWCGQSPSNIRTLLRFGYPPTKLKWYRGGIQNWENLGLTTVE